MKATILITAAALTCILTACNQPEKTTPTEVATLDQGVSQAAAEAAAAASYAAVAEAAARDRGYQEAIQDILAADIVAGRSYQRETEVAIAMKAIDLSLAPENFRVAYFEHILAWERLGRLRDAQAELTSDDQITGVLVYGGLCQLLGCSATPITDQIEAESRLEAAIEAAKADIVSTYNEVKREAVVYNVPVPQ